MKTITLIFLMLVGFLVPELSFADTAEFIAADGSTRPNWNLYVFGNAQVTANILTSIKFFVSSPVFSGLLSIFGVIGIFIAATAAGFSPSKNFPMFFQMIIIVWLVVYLSNGLTANVRIIDRLGSNSIMDTGEIVEVSTGAQAAAQAKINVDDVPAIVAIPVAMISSVGHWMTQGIEDNFPVPLELKLTGGGFNLGAQLIQDADKTQILDPTLKKSISNYFSDCVVPEMALGRISINQLMQSKDIWKDLEVTNPGLLTDFKGASFSGEWENIRKSPDFSEFQLDPKKGGVLACSTAYTLLATILEKEGLYNGVTGNKFMGQNNVAPLVNMYTSSMNWLTGEGVSGAAFVQQKAMLNTMNGAFRDAAVRTGNNELLMATNIAIAERSQKTSWVVAAELFNNTMGYIYAALQGFMMAVTPMVVFALMLPGFGMKVVINFLQIFIWLALWEPMLAVINFLVGSFTQSSVGSLLKVEGVTIANQMTISEMANNMSMAAGFLGTLVPMITWGLVKGGMAFTEFISAGVGSQFAGSAANQTASGNASMGTVSMNNISGNKMNMATQDAFGYMESVANASAGSILSSSSMGGSSTSLNDGKLANQAGVTSLKSIGTTLANSTTGTNQMAAGESGSAGTNVGNGLTAAVNTDGSKFSESGRAQALATLASHAQSFAEAASRGKFNKQDMTQGAKYIEQEALKYGVDAAALAAAIATRGGSVAVGGLGQAPSTPGAPSGAPGAPTLTGAPGAPSLTTSPNSPSTNNTNAGTRVNQPGIAQKAAGMIGGAIKAVTDIIDFTASGLNSKAEEGALGQGQGKTEDSNQNKNTLYSSGTNGTDTQNQSNGSRSSKGAQISDQASKQNLASFMKSYNEGISLATAGSETNQVGSSLSGSRSISFNEGMTPKDAMNARWGAEDTIDSLSAAQGQAQSSFDDYASRMQSKFEESKQGVKDSYEKADNTFNDKKGVAQGLIDQASAASANNKFASEFGKFMSETTADSKKDFTFSPNNPNWVKEGSVLVENLPNPDGAGMFSTGEKLIPILAAPDINNPDHVKYFDKLKEKGINPAALENMEKGGGQSWDSFKEAAKKFGIEDMGSLGRINAPLSGIDIGASKPFSW